MPRSSVDYADYNITVYRYCPYRCLYCYVWRNKLFSSRVVRGKYDPVSEALRIAKKAKQGERVVISFTSDPYPFEEAWMNRTRNVVFTLRIHSCATIMVLTKNPILALRDRDVMIQYIAGKICYPEAWLGTTITSADTHHLFSTVLEPNAPRTVLRLRALREYQNQGGKVWISIEPIIPIDHIDFYPETIVSRILDILDPEKIALIVLGRLNYIKQVKKHLPFQLPREEDARKYYRDHVPIAVDWIKEHNIPLHIKKELWKVLEE